MSLAVVRLVQKDLPVEQRYGSKNGMKVVDEQVQRREA